MASFALTNSLPSFVFPTAIVYPQALSLFTFFRFSLVLLMKLHRKSGGENGGGADKDDILWFLGWQSSTLLNLAWPSSG